MFYFIHVQGQNALTTLLHLADDMYTSICVLMYLYYIYLLISAMMDLLSDEIPPKFYERLRRRILNKVGDMWHGKKKIGKMDPLALYQNNGE